jgi:hypothetical protein
VRKETEQGFGIPTKVARRLRRPVTANQACAVRNHGDVDAEDRFLRWKVEKRRSELRDAESQNDRERIVFASRMISGTLDPRVIGGRTEFSKRQIITRFAPEFADLLATVERVAGPDTSSAPIAVLDAISRLRALSSRFGGFDIWIRTPRWASCDRVLLALVNRDHDAEDYLQWLLKNELKVDTALAPYVAAVLWTENGRRWRGWDEPSLYARLIRRARTRKYWDQRDAEWITPKPNTISLAELKSLPELVFDPIEFLYSHQGPIKLAELNKLAMFKSIDDRLAGLNLTRDESKYFTLKKICGLTQVEVKSCLGWDDAAFQRIKRSTDRKLKQASRQRVLKI